MGDVYGNVNVNYSYCKSVAQLKSAADYILGRRKEQVEDGVVKTEPHLYKAFGCQRAGRRERGRCEESRRRILRAGPP